MLKCFSTIDGLVNPVAIGDRIARVDLAGSYPKHFFIIRICRDAPNRYDFFTIELVLKGSTVVGRFEQTTRSGCDPPKRRVLFVNRDIGDTTRHVRRTDRTPLDLLEPGGLKFDARRGFRCSGSFPARSGSRYQIIGRPLGIFFRTLFGRWLAILGRFAWSLGRFTSRQIGRELLEKFLNRLESLFGRSNRIDHWSLGRRRLRCRLRGRRRLRCRLRGCRRLRCRLGRWVRWSLRGGAWARFLTHRQARGDHQEPEATQTDKTR